MNKHCCICLFFCLFKGVASEAQCTQMRLSGNADMPPISYAINEEKLVGIGFEFVRTIVQKEIRVEVARPAPLQRVMQWARDGHIDMFVGLQSDDYPKEWFTVLHPAITDSAYAVFYRRGKRVMNLDKLYGLRGAILRDMELKPSPAINLEIEHLQLLRTDSISQAIQLIKLKRIDYFIAPQWQTINTWFESGRAVPLAMLPEPIQINHVYLALSNFSPCIEQKAAIESEIVKAKQSGVMEALLEQSFLYTKAIDQFYNLIESP
ncbi:substrate-binding periplasmic protein [Pseudoalteromonas luteoviolacea]|nr:transporter substrate-binding domain-containing protein [Pseudoalteromonas luteoviolacea]